MVASGKQYSVTHVTFKYFMFVTPLRVTSDTETTRNVSLVNLLGLKTPLNDKKKNKVKSVLTLLFSTLVNG